MAWPLLPCKSNKCYIFRVCVCSLSYSACKAHAPYYIVTYGLYGCPICLPPHYLINGTIFEREKKLLNHWMCIWFSVQLVWNMCHFKKKWTGHVLMYSTCFSSQISLKLGFFSNKLSILRYKISWRSFTNIFIRYTGSNNIFSQFCERAKKISLKITVWWKVVFCHNA